MELFESHELFLEILRVEFVIIVKTKDSVVFKLLLEQLSDLSGSQLTCLQSISCILCCLILVFLVLNDFDTCFEEPVLLGAPDNPFLDSRPKLDDFKVLVNWSLEGLRQERDLSGLSSRALASRFGCQSLFSQGD